MSKEFINPPNLPNWEQSFSQIVVAPIGAARIIYVSGQVSVDEDKHLIGKDDLRVQAMRAFQNLGSALKAADATAADVVKLNIYVKDYQPADAGVVGEALRKHFPAARLPASTWLGVQSLAEKEFLIEVDAIAVVES